MADICMCGETKQNCSLESAAAAAIQTAERFETLAARTPDAQELLSNIAQGARHAAAEIRALKNQP